MAGYPGASNIKIIDTDNVAQALEVCKGTLGVSTINQLIAKGDIAGCSPWSKIGFTPTMNTTESDIWSKSGKYVFPTTAAGGGTWEVTSDLATADVDIGTELFAGTCDASGTTTRMNKVGVDFSATATAGDIVLIDKAGTLPEWGVITTAANEYIEFTGGLSSGGSCATARTYNILDSSAAKGAMAVRVEYLTSSFAEKSEIVKMNVNNNVALVNTDCYRVNSFRVIAVGTKATALNAAGGNLSLRLASDHTTTYSYITAGYTRARNIVYTVPVNKTLYIIGVHVGYAWVDAAKSQNQYCRFWTRANVDLSTGFKTGSIFYPYSEILSNGHNIDIVLQTPTKLSSGVDLKISGISTATGVATCALRGYLTTNA